MSAPPTTRAGGVRREASLACHVVNQSTRSGSFTWIWLPPVSRSRSWRCLGLAGGRPGTGLSEDPEEGCEPAALESESFPCALPGPSQIPGSLGATWTSEQDKRVGHAGEPHQERNWMLAKYSGRCAIRPEPIRPGDSIASLSEDSSTWVHATCHPSIEVVAAALAEVPPAARPERGPSQRKSRRTPKSSMVPPPGAVAVYTDGACSGNPGPGGWAWAADRDTWASGSEPASTNQRMEIRAALEAVTALDGPLIVMSDSTYVVNCFRDRWWAAWLDRDWMNSQRKPVANRDLWEPLLRALNERGDVAFRWVKGHSGHEMNDFVDHLAVMASLSGGDSKGRR
jgi:ribonuclease HI